MNLHGKIFIFIFNNHTDFVLSSILIVGTVFAVPVIVSQTEVSDICISIYSCHRHPKTSVKLINLEITVVIRLLLEPVIYCFTEEMCMLMYHKYIYFIDNFISV